MSKRGEHTRIGVIKQVAVKGPEARVVTVEGDHHALPRRHQDRVPHRAGEARPLAPMLFTLGVEEGSLSAR